MKLKNALSQRQIRFGELIRSIISEIISRNYILKEESIVKTITVSFVKMSRDLRIASVYIMPLGGNDKYEVLDLLNKNKFLFQKELVKAKLKSKFTPKINFYLDDSFEEAEKIEKLLLNEKVSRDINNAWFRWMDKYIQTIEY